jgi:hypothetical protein
METADLIDSLANELEPVSQAAVPLGLTRAVVLGGAVSFVIMWAWLGIRPDLDAAVDTTHFWMKFGYALALTIFAVLALERLSRPVAEIPRAGLGFAATVGLLALIAAVEWMLAAPGARHSLMMGHSASVCSLRIVLLSLPVFASVCWRVRSFAPTRMALAGAAAGLAAGAAGAWVYAFHCDESAAPFVVIFYTLGITAVGALGGLIGRFALRW